jgi:5'-nucleotidase
VYDVSRPAGERVVSATVDGKPIDAAASYRVATNSFLASGGDNFTVLKDGIDRRDVGVDLDSLESYLAASPAIPVGDRVRNVGPVPAGQKRG